MGNIFKQILIRHKLSLDLLSLNCRQLIAVAVLRDARCLNSRGAGEGHDSN